MVTTFQCLVAAQEANAAIHRFRVRLSKTIATQPFTGRVYIFFSDQMPREPRLDFKFIKAEPFVALDIENWKPGETITFTSDQPDGMLAYPVPLAEMKLDGFRAQAVARLNPFDPEVGGGEGNARHLDRSEERVGDGSIGRHDVVTTELRLPPDHDPYRIAGHEHGLLRVRARVLARRWASPLGCCGMGKHHGRKEQREGGQSSHRPRGSEKVEPG